MMRVMKSMKRNDDDHDYEENNMLKDLRVEELKITRNDNKKFVVVRMMMSIMKSMKTNDNDHDYEENYQFKI